MHSIWLRSGKRGTHTVDDVLYGDRGLSDVGSDNNLATVDGWSMKHPHLKPGHNTRDDLQ